MRIEKVVVNASPLIVLFKSHQADLLPQLFTDIVIPGSVWQEVTMTEQNDLAAQQLPAAAWVQRIEVAMSPVVAAWDLGAGESEVLSFALVHSQYRAVIDDAAARRCARALGISTLGTGGVLVLAKRRGFIASIGDAIQAVQDAGLWLSTDIVNLLRDQAGE